MTDRKKKPTIPRIAENDPIGVALRRLHQEVVAEPIPDDFMRLLTELDSKFESDKK